MTVFLLDPGGLDPNGHHLPLDRLIAAGARARGQAVEIGFNRHARESFKSRLGEGRPAFSTHLYALPELSKALGTPAALDEAERFARQADAIFGPGLRDGDAVVMHTVNYLHVAGIARWLASRSVGGLAVSLVLRFESDFMVEPERRDLARAAYAEGFAALARLAGARVRLFCDSPALAADYQPLSPLPVELVPIPIEWPEGAAAMPPPHRPAGAPPVFGFFGEPRADKGGTEVIAAVRLARQRGVAARFLLQMTDEALYQRLVRSQLAPVTDFIRGSLPPAELHRAMASVDVVLVPYDPAKYRARTSHLMVEALGLGRPVICVEGSWLADEARRIEASAVTIIPRLGTEDMLAGIVAAAERLPALRAAAPATAPLWRRAHSAEAFLESFLDRQL